MNITTFGAFTTARLGIYAAQKSLEVTGHNISNINTTGYCRQAVDQVSLRVGATNHYASANGGVSGSGVLVTGMSQFRDPYLDIRYRTENSNVGAMDTKLAGLEQLSGILDEVGTGDDGEKGEGILAAQFQDLRDQLAKLTGDQATEDEFLTLVRSSADSLAKLLNNYADRISEVKKNQESSLKTDVSAVNDILKGIQNLNENILKSEIYGDSALELRDQRNLLIDSLSQYMKIDVTYSPVSVGAGKTVDKLVIKTSGDNPITLVDGNYAGKLTMGDGLQKNPAFDSTAVNSAANPRYLKNDGTTTDDAADAAKLPYAVTISALSDKSGVELTGSQPYQFGDTELYGSLQSSRELLTESGEYTNAGMLAADPDASTKRGIPYYQNALDSLAQKFASVLNAANTGYMYNSSGNYVDKDGVEIKFDIPQADGTTVKGPLSFKDTLTDAQKTQLETDGKALGGVLFSNSTKGDDTTGITAANISISSSWSANASLLQNSFQALDGKNVVGSSDNRNILHIIAEFDGKQEYKPTDVVGSAAQGDRFFYGSFEEMFTNVEETLAADVKSTTTMLNNYSVSSTQLNVSRESVAGVDLNDEAMNLMQFQKSYSAACRLMTTLDETLDKLINGTGVTGR
ncbi:flagellar hook-associated protein FlgK [Oscillibacter ruminantium]|uniref:flagellar hook-associated protein FlgK n=1 Tax=Oscillibacter ruminantium TaxID=1263547 RepID=UPI0025AAD120|nr:flagellar basal body rod C-terminal domain-containing protein [Oscillibacter ruminantium]MDN0032096.1 flagellar basal body rod C-terminal domain-containing protein [Oscillibacter valericigenes]MEA5041212.1 flagellar basal body rod C-terminal domain-containing protein [Oscillibacter ruminantium]